MRHDEDELVAAPVTLPVLAILAEGENHGFAILERIRRAQGRELGWADAMVYPLLHRLRRLGYLTTEWRVTPDGRRRRCYAITDRGRAELAAATQREMEASRERAGRRRGIGWRLAVPIASIEPVPA